MSLKEEAKKRGEEPKVKSTVPEHYLICSLLPGCDRSNLILALLPAPPSTAGDAGLKRYSQATSRKCIVEFPIERPNRFPGRSKGPKDFPSITSVTFPSERVAFT